MFRLESRYHFNLINHFIFHYFSMKYLYIMVQLAFKSDHKLAGEGSTLARLAQNRIT